MDDYGALTAAPPPPPPAAAAAGGGPAATSSHVHTKGAKRPSPDLLDDSPSAGVGAAPSADSQGKSRQRSRRKNVEVEDDASKRRCVSTACVACRKRKSKCDGNLPACAACSQVYGTECIYDPNSDHRRKGVYKNDFDSGKSRNTTLHTLIEAILNSSEDEAFELVRELRRCDSLDAVAERIAGQENGFDSDDEDEAPRQLENGPTQEPTFERQLYGKMGDLRIDDGTTRFIGGTSHLIHIDNDEGGSEADDVYPQQENAVASWTSVTNDANLIMHLLNMYFTWHYPYFTTLSKTLFYRDFSLGKPPPNTRRKTHFCTPVLVNAILAVGCHFTSHPGARQDPNDSATAGDHFFREAKRLAMEDDEHERPRLTNIQAFALMSVREAGCGREAKGWVYSGMAFRMVSDMGLNLNSGQLTKNKHVNGNEAEEDLRRITFWGCYHFDKCWSNYLGRIPQLPTNILTVPKFEVFLDEESAQWSPYTDSGFSQAHAQPARIRATQTQIIKLCEISNDLMKDFYNPIDMEKTRGKSAELKLLSSLHTRLETWRRELPKEMEPREGGLSSVLLMHMFFQLLFIHLFRPFLRYNQATSPLPPNVSPRKHCTQAAAMISKLMRLYKRSHGLRQICNIAVYIAHSACTIHLLNLPDRNAKRDITHGVKHLEEIAEGWLCARRSLAILSVLARKWKIQLPDEAAAVLSRTDRKFAKYSSEVAQTLKQRPAETIMDPSQLSSEPQPLEKAIKKAPSTSTSTDKKPSKPRTSNGSSTSQQQQHQQQPRANSATHSAPPLNANGLQARSYPSNHTTPLINMAPQQQQQYQRPTSTSPSEMFGGVEQLLRDSQDWVYRDQSQIANGFGNWDAIHVDPSTWANAVMPDDGGTLAAALGAQPGVMGSAAVSNLPPLARGGGNGMIDAEGFPVVDWMHAGHAAGGFPEGNMAIYNEEEWYQ